MSSPTSPSSPASTPAAPTVDAVIRRLEAERFDAVVDGDFAKFATYCHPNLVYTHSNAVVDSLESYVEKCSQGFYKYLEIDHPIHNVVVVGNAALVIGEMNARVLVQEQPKNLANASLAVWVNEDDRWQLLAFQPTVKPS